MMNKIGEKIYALDLFRFVIAFIVFLFHLNIHLGVEIPEYYLARFVSQGAVCMSAFFMLSGFVLSYVYSQKDFSQFDEIKKFYFKRFSKIYPSYVVAVLLFWLLSKEPVMTTVQNIVLFPMQLLVLQAYFSSTFNYILNGGVWFVSVMVFLYFLFPFLCRGINCLDKYQYKSLLVLYFLSLYPSIIQSYFGGTSNIYISPVFRLPEFVIGMFLGLVYINKRGIKKYSGWTLWVAVFTLVLGVALLSKNNFLNHISFKNNYTYYNVICVPLFAFIIYRLGFVTNLYFLAVVKSRLVGYLSKISYSFFLTQGVAIMVMRNFFAECDKATIFVLALFCNLLFAICNNYV